MHLSDGRVGDQQVVPRTWIGRLLRPQPHLSAAFGQALEIPGLTGPDTNYHDQWWVLDPRAGIYAAIGIHGQILFIHRPTDSVFVKLSTQPRPVDRTVFRYQIAGFLAIADELARSRLSPPG